MTEQEHLAISRDLALAIGHHRSNIAIGPNAVLVYVGFDGNNFRVWSVFDYRDELIAFRVAERFDCFPTSTTRPGEWYSWVPGTSGVCAGTPQLAIARAVIAAKGVK